MLFTVGALLTAFFGIRFARSFRIVPGGLMTGLRYVVSFVREGLIIALMRFSNMARKWDCFKIDASRQGKKS